MKLYNGEILKITEHSIEDIWGFTLFSVDDESITCVSVAERDFLLLGSSSGRLVLYSVNRTHTRHLSGLAILGCAHDTIQGSKEEDEKVREEGEEDHKRTKLITFAKRYIPPHRKQKNDTVALRLLRKKACAFMDGVGDLWHSRSVLLAPLLV